MANSKLSVDQLNSLLRLYLEWPHHVDESANHEANEFYLWLAEELDENDLAEITNGLDGVKEFINDNPEVIPAARYLKSRDTQSNINARVDARVAINTQVFILVYDCASEPLLEGAIVRGIMMDMARNGMRLEASLAIPPGSIISLTVAQTGAGVTLYHLMGEVRWLTSTPKSNHLGINIFNIEDFKRWEEFYTMSASY